MDQRNDLVDSSKHFKCLSTAASPVRTRDVESLVHTQRLHQADSMSKLLVSAEKNSCLDTADVVFSTAGFGDHNQLPAQDMSSESCFCSDISSADETGADLSSRYLHKPSASSNTHIPAIMSTATVPAAGGVFDANSSCSDWNASVGCADESDESGASEATVAGERWPPLGAERDSIDNAPLSPRRRECSNDSSQSERVQLLEEEHEHLNNSLMALTTHFAQVQFRLKQIVEAPTDEKQPLLEELETFAFRGVPDIRQPLALNESGQHQHSDKLHYEQLIDTQRWRQRELMQQLKCQLEDLEEYAYQTGDAGLPSSVVLEKQRVIIDELKGKLNVQFDNLDSMSTDDLRTVVDCAISQLVSPLRMKEQLVGQLKTQVQDLERFISFLQGDGRRENRENLRRFASCGGSVITTALQSSTNPQQQKQQHNSLSTRRSRVKRRVHRHLTQEEPENIQQDISSEYSPVMRRVWAMLHVFTLAHLGCGGGGSDSSMFTSAHHAPPHANNDRFNELFRRVEASVSAMTQLARESSRRNNNNNNNNNNNTLADSESDSNTPSSQAPSGGRADKLTLVARKQLSAALRDLLQHGLLTQNRSQNRSLLPFGGCLSSRGAEAPPAAEFNHAWHVILAYYRQRGGVGGSNPGAVSTGREASNVQRRLSNSFALSQVGQTTVPQRHSLLGVIGEVISSHTPLKRSADSQFKAFVCHALNYRKLSSWLRLIVRSPVILEQFYAPWSCVAHPRFEDVMCCLARLEKLHLTLIADLAVRQLNNIHEAF